MYLLFVKVTNLFLFSLLVQNVIITLLTCKYPELREYVHDLFWEQRPFLQEDYTIMADYVDQYMPIAARSAEAGEWIFCSGPMAADGMDDTPRG